MSSGVPSFIQQTTNYEDIFGEDDDKTIPIAATPISKMKETSVTQEKSSSSSKRKLPPPAIDSAKNSGSRAKRPRGAATQGDEGSSPQLLKIFNMAGHQIPEEIIAKWDRMSLAESAKAIPLANAQSFFHYLKHGEAIVEAARGDQKLAEEVKQLKASIKTKDEERRKLVDVNKKLKASETKLIKEREKLDATVIALDTEKEELVVANNKQVHELELKLEALNMSVATERSLHKDDKKSKYLAGYNNGIKDYFKATYEKFPDLDWSLLGADAVKMVEDIRGKEATHAAGPGGDQVTLPAMEQVPKGGADGETQVEESKTADPVDDNTTPEVTHDTLAP